MQSVYVVTHPEATHHVHRLVGGWYDSELTAQGRIQAGSIARYLRSVIPADSTAQLVSSDLRRTAQTAAVIGDALGILPALDAGLREKSYGVAEGRLQSWLDSRFVFPPAQGERLDHDEGIEGSEAKRDWVRRTYAAVERLEQTPAEHRVVVTHGGTASCVIAAWMRIPMSACAYATFHTGTGSVSVLEEDDRFHNRALTVLGSGTSSLD